MPTDFISYWNHSDFKVTESYYISVRNKQNPNNNHIKVLFV